jgi:hypothetical protein
VNVNRANKQNKHEHASQIDIDAQHRLENFNKFTQKDNRIEYIEFDDIIQPYVIEFEFDIDDVYNNLLTKNCRDLIKHKAYQMNHFFSQKTANTSVRYNLVLLV